MAADVEGVLADLRHRHAVGEQPDLGSTTRSPAAMAACRQLESSGSTPMTLISGRRYFT
jgi:hypothetical protein